MKLQSLWVTAFLVIPMAASAAIEQVARLTPTSPIEGESFGISVDIDGQRAIVGADRNVIYGGVPAEPGSAYLFEQILDGNELVWTQVAELTPCSPEIQDDCDPALGELGESIAGFGISVAIDGNTAIVGAPGVNSNEGMVYVFEKQAGVWARVQRLSLGGVFDPGNPFALFKLFGFTLDIEGDVIAIGANIDTEILPFQGAVYVYERVNGVWPEEPTQKLTAAQPGLEDVFGSSVSLEGDRLLVGAPLYDANPDIIDSGAVYYFEKGTNGWSQTQILTAQDPESNDSFGQAVSQSEGSAIVSAPFKNLGNGTAYIFDLGGAGTWNQTDKLAPASGSPVDNFAASVALDEDIAVIAAPFRGENVSGSVYVYNRVDGQWTQAPEITGEEEPGELFGWAHLGVALDGTRAIIGASGASLGAGSAFIFRSGDSDTAVDEVADDVQDVLDEMLVDNPDLADEVEGEVEKVLDKLEDAFEELNDGDPEAAVDELKDAVKELEDLQDSVDDAGTPEEAAAVEEAVLALMIQITDVALGILDDELQIAIDSGASNKDLNKVNKEIAKGDKQLVKGNFEKALKEYADAVGKAVKAQ